MKNDEKLLKDRVNKNDNSKEKIEKKKNKNINEKGASGIFTPLDVPIVSVFENQGVYLQLIIPQYFISNKSGIWSLSLIVHSKG